MSNPQDKRIAAMKVSMDLWNRGVGISDLELALCVEGMRYTVAMIECLEEDGIVTKAVKQTLRGMEDMQERRKR